MNTLSKIYALLSANLIWTAIITWLTIPLEFSGGQVLCLALVMIFSMIISMLNKDSVIGLIFLFIFTGVTGAEISTSINHYLHLQNGSELIVTSTGITALIFGILSGYAIYTKKDFNYLGGFLFIGLFGLVIVSIVSLLLGFTAIQLALSYFSILIFSGYILYDTSEIINNRYGVIEGVISLYLDIINIFLNLLQILSNLDD